MKIRFLIIKKNYINIKNSENIILKKNPEIKTLSKNYNYTIK